MAEVKTLKVSVNEVAAPVWSADSTKQEIVVPVGPDSSGGIPAAIYCVKPETPGPYTITVKGGGKNGVSTVVKQPLFDYLGNVAEPGSVRISGTLTNTNKQTNTTLTLTAANTSPRRRPH